MAMHQAESRECLSCFPNRNRYLNRLLEKHAGEWRSRPVLHSIPLLQHIPRLISKIAFKLRKKYGLRSNVYFSVLHVNETDIMYNSSADTKFTATRRDVSELNFDVKGVQVECLG